MAKIGTGLDTELTQKYVTVKVQNDMLTSLLASERSERDTYRANTIENRGCQFIYLLASERSERDLLSTYVTIDPKLH